MLYRIITEWWKLGSSRDISSWRSRSKQLKGRWKFGFKNTHTCLKHIDLAPLPSTSKVISLIDPGRNTLFSCHRRHNRSPLRIYCTYREKRGRNVKSMASYIRNNNSQSDLCFPSVKETLPFQELIFPSVTNSCLQIKSIKISDHDNKLCELKNDNLSSVESLYLGFKVKIKSSLDSSLALKMHSCFIHSETLHRQINNNA